MLCLCCLGSCACLGFLDAQNNARVHQMGARYIQHVQKVWPDLDAGMHWIFGLFNTLTLRNSRTHLFYWMEKQHKPTIPIQSLMVLIPYFFVWVFLHNTFLRHLTFSPVCIPPCAVSPLLSPLSLSHQNLLSAHFGVFRLLNTWTPIILVLVIQQASLISPVSY